MDSAALNSLFLASNRLRDARITDAAIAADGEEARFVREASSPPSMAARPQRPPTRRRASDELVHQLGRVLNNLRRLERIAEVEVASELVRAAWSLRTDARR